MDNPVSPTPIAPKPPISLNLAFLIITLISLLLSTFFIYQNWRLNQRLEALIRSQPTPTPLPAEVSTKEGDPTANWKTYTNNKYQFSFKYPNNLKLLDPVGYEHTGYKNSTDYQNSLSKTTAVTDRLFEFNIDSFPKDTYPDKAKLTFDELIEDEVKVYCGGDGITGSFHCDKLLTSESFVTDNGAQGKKLIYATITTNSKNKSTTQQQTGSLYAFNLSDATTSRIILFHTPNFFAPNSEDQKVFEQIISTFKFTK
ncbi:hypothetical protein HYU91_02340 [Candidatus Collierbacteria bacterium]|nr:hypothetical protein [Candidatus Collierbacteria bacterium]